MDKSTAFKLPPDLNQSLALKPPGTSLTLKPRIYQRELFQKALDNNVIIYLGTGLGKTFIIALYLNSPHIDSQIQLKRKVVFLAITQDLTKQQAEYLNKQIPYSAKIYCGRSAKCGQHIDHWNKDAWDAELNQIDVLFMTPQIFNAAISTNLIDWRQLSAVIFDEVHHACRNRKGKETNTPYVSILKHYNSFYKFRPEVEKPRLIGLTASLINNMPKDRSCISGEIDYIEKLLSGRCVTDLVVQDKRPKIAVQRFNWFNMSAVNDGFVTIFETFSKYLNQALETQSAQKFDRIKHLSPEQVKVLAFQNRLKLAAAGFSIKPSSFPKVIDGLNNVRTRCGVWMLKAVCAKLISALSKHSINTCLPAEVKKIYQDFGLILTAIHTACDQILLPLKEESLLSHTRPKPKALLEVLKREYSRTKAGIDGKSSFSCLVFVQSRLEVVALCEWLQNVSAFYPEYNFIKCDYAIGIAATMSSKYSCITKRKASAQYKVLNDFREGILNTIITTSVLEEGIDLPVCSTVIRYNAPNNFRQYIQSRGRARQDISSMLFIAEREEYLNLRDMLMKFNDFEVTLRQHFKNNNIRKESSTHYSVPTKSDNYNIADVFTNDDHTIRINAPTAKTILHMYCQYLTISNPFIDGVRYEKIDAGLGLHQTILYLPAACPLSDEPIRGGVKSSEELAEDSAIIAAIEKLYRAGEINNHLAPVRFTDKNIDRLLASQNLELNCEPLDKSLEGYPTNDEHTALFDNNLLKPPTRSIGANCESRVYSLIRLNYVSSDTTSRLQTEHYFEKPSIGIIVDSSIGLSFIPDSVFSHYGHFKIEKTLISDNLLIKNRVDHSVYLNFTHRFLFNCLNLRGINLEIFSRHALFYIVPLKDDDTPDILKLQSCLFATNSQKRINDIVRLKPNYRNRQDKDADRLLLVKAVRTDMSATSCIPGTKHSFIDYAERIHGRGIVRQVNQPIIEVIPISKDLATLTEGKKVLRGYESRNIFFLDQFLESISDDPYIIFQGTLTAPLIYKLYQMHSAIDLDCKFLEATKDMRQELHETTSKNKPVEFDNIITEEVAANNIDQASVSQDDSNNNDLQQSEGSDSEESDEDSNNLSYSQYDSETDNDDDLIIGPEYKDLVSKKTLDLEHENEGLEELKRWDMSQYKVADLAPFNIDEVFDSPTYEDKYLDSLTLAILSDTVRVLTITLIDQIANFKKAITSDSTFLDENLEFSKRQSKVDTTLIAPLKFDRNAKPFLSNCIRHECLLMALSQKRACELFNYERFEFVGDSYLKYVSSVVLFSKLDGNEGFLTSARMKLTSNKYFIYLAKKNRLGNYSVANAYSKSLLGCMLGRFPNPKNPQEFHNKLRSKQLADTFESIIGCYLLCQGEFEALLAMEWLGFKIFDDSTFMERHENAVVFAPPATALQSKDVNDHDYRRMKAKFKRIESTLNYHFNDPSFIIQAFTHASATTKVTRSYERLEFLGDALLDYLVAMTLVDSMPKAGPGQLTASKSALVNNSTFAKLAIKYGFDLYIQHCCVALYDELNKVRLAMDEDPELSCLDLLEFDRITKLLADTFESVAGAIYLDSGCSLDSLWSIYYPMMKDLIDAEVEKPTRNLLMELFEKFPGKNRIIFHDERIDDEEGLAFNVTCVIEAFDKLDSYREFTGLGLNKKEAKLRAARAALEALTSDPLSQQERRELNRNYVASNNKTQPRPRQSVGRGRATFRGGRGGRGGVRQRPRN